MCSSQTYRCEPVEPAPAAHLFPAYFAGSSDVMSPVIDVIAWGEVASVCMFAWKLPMLCPTAAPFAV
jgi:hypothetical protein